MLSYITTLKSRKCTEQLYLIRIYNLTPFSIQQLDLTFHSSVIEDASPPTCSITWPGKYLVPPVEEMGKLNLLPSLLPGCFTMDSREGYHMTSYWFYLLDWMIEGWCDCVMHCWTFLKLHYFWHFQSFISSSCASLSVGLILWCKLMLGICAEQTVLLQ